MSYDRMVTLLLSGMTYDAVMKLAVLAMGILKTPYHDLMQGALDQFVDDLTIL